MKKSTNKSSAIGLVEAKSKIIFIILFIGYATYTLNRKGVSLVLPKLIGEGLNKSDAGKFRLEEYLQNSYHFMSSYLIRLNYFITKHCLCNLKISWRNSF